MFDCTFCGRLPGPTSAARFPWSFPPASRGKAASMSCSRFPSWACALLASPRAWVRSPRRDEAMSLFACETTVSPSDEPSTIPIPSARKTATSESAWYRKSSTVRLLLQTEQDLDLEPEEVEELSETGRGGDHHDEGGKRRE